MFSHIMVGSNDIERSKTFYDAVFGAVGGKPGMQDPKGRLVYAHDGGRLLVTPPLDGEAATPGNGATIGFAMEGPEQARAWHQAGVENGGTVRLWARAGRNGAPLRGDDERTSPTSVHVLSRRQPASAFAN